MEETRQIAASPVADSLMGETAPSQARHSTLFYAAVIGTVVLFWALFGIFTRPVGHLAAFWPANALLLGLMVRFPRLATWQGWCAAFVGYLNADLVTGGHPVDVLLLTSANMAGVSTGYALMGLVSEPDRRLRRPLSVLYLALVVVVAASSAGLVGSIAEPILFGGTPFSGWTYWFVAELVNYIAILPVILSMPEPPALKWPGRRQTHLITIDPVRMLPALAVPLSAVAGMLIGGPGAVAFPVPALLWCAVSYSVFVNALMALLFSAWTLLALSRGYLPVSLDIDSRATLMSMRVGVTLIALAPLVVASVMAARNELLARLQHIADHDNLTGLSNRGAFRMQAGAALTSLTAANRPVATLMLDIDHFKLLNDTHGHAAGDRVLAEFAGILRANLRGGDHVGRVGGEEFAVLLADCGAEVAAEVAGRIVAAVNAAAFELEDGSSVSATISIGVAVAGDADLEKLLAAADEALYRAKQAGRNRFEVS